MNCAFIKRLFYLIVLAGVFSCAKENAYEIAGMVYIPSGEFTMGSEEVDKEALGKEFGLRSGLFYEDERPMRRVKLKGYYIDKYEVTNRQYKEFMDSARYNAPPTWTGGMYLADRANHPVNNVSWYDAHAYCTWAGKRLPTEEEWEKAARWPDGLRYPWGNDYDEKKANLVTGSTAPVGSYEQDKSYYGIYDMGGNVMEWVDAWYEPYPGSKAENKDFGKSYRVIRGSSGSVLGHYVIGKIFARSASRHYYDPSGAGDDGGIRCAKSPEAK